MVLHGSLVVGGFILWQGVPSDLVAPRATGSDTEFVSRPVKVAAPSTEKPVSRESLPEDSPQRAKPAASPPVATVQSDPADRPATRPSTNAPKTQTLPGPDYPKAGNPVPRSLPLAGQAARRPEPKSVEEERDAERTGWSARPTPNSSPPSGEDGTATRVTRRATPVARPEFNLSQRFPQLASVTVKARFEVNEDGTYEATLLSSSGDPTADVVIMGRLLEYKWIPAMKSGVAEKDTRVLDINLEG